MGESPLQLELLACKHTLKLVKDDFKPLEETITLDHNQQLLYQHTFTEKMYEVLPASNCFIVSQSGTYSFATVKGNSSQSVGQVSSVEVLWETFGTATKPNVGDLIQDVIYKDGSIEFSTAKPFREGNALIAAKDKKGTILWSWHIWMTDQPEEQVYYNNAGIMMDRNLGATSASPGDVGALGLLYQWGRKDPFLNSSSISESIEAQATNPFPKPQKTSRKIGTIAYATSHPTTYIYNDGGNYDWYYSGSSRSTDNTRWQSSKTIYDPCPAGWRVPDGGREGVWAIAIGSYLTFSHSYDSTNEGLNFSSVFGSDSMIWYPASGYRYGGDGLLGGVGNRGDYWSVSPDGMLAYYLYFYYYGNVGLSYNRSRDEGLAVRCLQE